jgi:hypothetical protein
VRYLQALHQFVQAYKSSCRTRLRAHFHLALVCTNFQLAVTSSPWGDRTPIRISDASMCRRSAGTFMRQASKNSACPQRRALCRCTTYRPLRCPFISFLLAGGTSRTFSKLSFESKRRICRDRRSGCHPQCPTRQLFSIADPRALLRGCPVSQLDF